MLPHEQPDAVAEALPGPAAPTPRAALKVQLPSSSASQGTVGSPTLSSAKIPAHLDGARQLSPFAHPQGRRFSIAVPYLQAPFGVGARDGTPDADELQAKELLERWEKARIRQDRKRQENLNQVQEHEPGHDTYGRQSGGSPPLASPLTSPRRAGRVQQGGELAPARSRRMSDMLIPPGSNPLFKENNSTGIFSTTSITQNDNSDTLRKLPVFPDAQSSPVPVGSRKTRRNSYSVGYSSLASLPGDFGKAFGKGSQPTSPDALHAGGSSGGAPLLPGTQSTAPIRIGSTTNNKVPMRSPPPWLAIPGTSVSGEEPRQSSQQTNSTAAMVSAGKIGTPMGASPAESSGFGGKLRKLLGRTTSRANVLKPQAAGSANMTAPRSITAYDSGADDQDGNHRRSDSSDESGDTGRNSRTSDANGMSGGGQGGDTRLTGAHGRKGSQSVTNSTATTSQLRPLLMLSPFVPRLLMEEIANTDDRYQAFDQGAMKELGKASSGMQPNMYEFQGAVMIADVKGFTQLTEILSKKGTAGVELLTNCMNNYFTRVINMITAFDGDVVKFAGDSMIVVFSPTLIEAKEKDQGIRAATMRCVQCAHVLAGKLGHMRMKMNGQIEPMNMAANDAIDMEEGGIVDTDLLRRHATAVANAKRASLASATPQATTPAGIPPSISSARLSATAGSIPYTSTPQAGAGGMDARSMQAVQHAAQQVALNLTGGPGGSSDASTSVASPSQSGSGRGSPISIHESGHSGQLGALTPGEPTTQPNSMFLGSGSMESGVMPTYIGGVTAEPGSAKAKKTGWLTTVMGGPKRQGSTQASNSSGGGSSKAGKGGQDASGGTGQQAAGTGGSGAAGGTSAGGAGSPVNSAANALRGGRGRARTEAGLMGAAAALRDSPRTGQGSNDAALWGEGAGGGMVRREMSLASKLNIPPPVRQLAVNTARNSSITPGGSFGTELPHMHSTQSTAMSSFTTDLGMSRLAGALPAAARRGPAESWASKFQNLSSGVMATQQETVAFQIERSNTSLGVVRALLPDVLQTSPGGETAELERRQMSTTSQGVFDVSNDSAVSGPLSVLPSGKSRLGLRPAFGSGGKKTGAGALDLPLVPVSINSQQGGQTEEDSKKSTNEANVPEPTTSAVEWSEDSYAVDMVGTSFTGPSSGLGRGRGGLQWRGSGLANSRGGSTNLNNANIDGYMAPGGAGQPIGEASETDSPVRHVDSRSLQLSAAYLGLRNPSVVIQACHSNPRMLLPAASNPISGSIYDLVPVLQASQLTSLSIAAMPSGSHSLLAHDASSTGSEDPQGEAGSFQWIVPHHRLPARHHQSTLDDIQGPPAGPVAEGLFKRDVAYELASAGGSNVTLNGVSSSDVGSSSMHATDGVGRRSGLANIDGGPKASFMGKVKGWFGSTTSKRSSLGPGEGREDDVDDDSDGSASPVNNSLGYQTAPMGRIQAAAPTYTKARDPVMEEVQNSEFSLKIMVSAGSVCVFQVGGLIDEVTDPTQPEVPHWEFFIGDRPMAPLRDQYNRRRCIAQLAAIEDHAEAGEVVGSDEVINLLQDDWDVDLIPPKMDVGKLIGPVHPFIIPQRQQQTTVRLMRSKSKQPQPPDADDDTAPKPVDASPEGQDGEAMGGNALAVTTGEPELVASECSQLPEEIQRRLAGVLRMHVLGSVRSRIEAGHLDFINEIRKLTCMFLGFPSLLQETDTATHEDQISCVQYCIQKVQEVMRQWDGSLLQFRCDEKGFIGICAFGLPGHTHEDNPSRGILAALDLQHRIKQKQHKVCIGVTSGDLLCTCVGARKIRSEYTVFGDAINLSARLMVKCKNGMGEILCDEPTHAQAKFKACFEELEPLTVKGKKLPVHVFQVTPFDKDTAAANAVAENQALDNNAGMGKHSSLMERPLVGRDAETTFILNRAANMIAGMATGGAIVIEGNTGMGKTKLLMEVRKSLERTHAETVLQGKPAFHLFFGVADIANKSTKLYPWRRMFQELFALDRHSSINMLIDGNRPSAQNSIMAPSSASTLPPGGASGATRTSASTTAGAVTSLGNQLASQIPSYNTEWSKHLAELVDIPLHMVPRGTHQVMDDFVTPGGGMGDVPLPGAQPRVQVTIPSHLGGASGGSMINPNAPVSQGPHTSDRDNSIGGTMGSPTTPRNVLSSSGGGVLPGPGPSSLGGTESLATAGIRGLQQQDSSLMGRALAGAWAGIGSLTGTPNMRKGSVQGLPGVPHGRMPAHRRSVAIFNEAAMHSLTGMLAGTGSSIHLDHSTMDGPPGSGHDRPTMERVGINARTASLANPGLIPSRSLSMRRSPNMQSTAAMAGALATAAAPTTSQTGGTGSQVTPALSAAGPSTMSPGMGMGGPGPGTAGQGGTGQGGGAPLKKNSLNFLVHVIREFTALYGPITIMLENLHEFDMWSWQLLVKVAEVLSPSVLILATTRPIELSPSNVSTQAHSKAALYQKVSTMYRHLLKLPTTSKVHLEPFTFQQTKALMQVLADNHIFPDQYVVAVKEKTGGMPLYIEKVTEFLCQKPWLAEQGGEFTATVNKMIRNLNFQQVIIERMDRLKPVIHLTLKVASVMGQWVDLDILYKFYPINNTKEELRVHLAELERGNFLKPTDTDGVWEFNMVERDIVYEVIPHYQRRRLHAKLAQELERSLEEHHVATLTTIAYHWNQACMGHEVTEVECALKAIEFWQRAAEAAYSSSSLMEALRLYQKAAQIAELLGDSMSNSFQANASHRASTDDGTSVGTSGRRAGGVGNVSQRRRGTSQNGAPRTSQSGGGGGGGTDADDHDDNNASFTAVGAAFRGQLNWSLISRITRAQWEKSMASCCLGIVMQHRLEFNNQMEYWDSEDYFALLTEHAIQGLMLLGAPHPQDVLVQDVPVSRWSKFFCCLKPQQDEPSGWQEGVVLQDQEVTEIRDILLVLIIAAEHYSLQQDGDEYTRLLTFCKRVCIFFNKCSDTGLDPFTDVQLACTTRIKNFKARRGTSNAADFELNAPMTDDLLGDGVGFEGGPLDIAAVVGLNQELHIPSYGR